ncbi:MAG: histidinol-phosphate aminotransferase [Candidatus Sumerlaeota bacterium]|nr:histidinol-phosphate aminotransferase [Candidatus Sumerlaeota bacterium]
MTSRTPAIPAPRKSVAGMKPYLPGEQPADPAIIKLNTNENPYPPAPGVTRALHALTEARLRKYPDPVCRRLREAVGGSLGLAAESIIVTNGSDEILKMAVEAYVGPGDSVGYLWPTYSLYPVFVEEAGAKEVRLPWKEGGPSQEEVLLDAPRDLRLLYITNPNPPIGLPVDLAVTRRVAKERPETLVVVDEAYIAYGGESAVALVREGLPNVLVTRTFSKSHSLAGMRVGLGLAVPELMDVLYRVKDSYNVNVAAQEAALASWTDAEHTREVVECVCRTRAWTRERLVALGFDVPESQGNFLFARRADAAELFQRLRGKKILVRYFDTPELRGGLRITIGTDEEMRALVGALESAE